LDLGAPAPVSGVPGALRLLAANGSFTLADNVDVTAASGKVLTLSGGTIAGGLQNSVQLKADGEIYSVAVNGASNMLLGNAANGVAFSSTKVTSNTFGGPHIFNVFNSSAVLLRQMILQDDGLYQTLGATTVKQPVIQYGTATGSGASGTVVVTIPTAYTNATSYVVQVTMQDSPTAQLYATPTAANKFDIGWTSAGVGTQNIMWTTFGT
jgi:hypothetical protein